MAREDMDRGSSWIKETEGGSQTSGPSKGADMQVSVTLDEQQPLVGGQRADEEVLARWRGRWVFPAWLLVCFSTGPTYVMMRSFVPASLQTIAHELGHPKGHPAAHCRPRGDDCYIYVGGRDVQFTAYVLYMRALYTSIEGLIAIVLMGLADFSNYRKWLMTLSIVMYGALATPFVSQGSKTYGALILMSVLYCLMLCCNTIYTITEGSYIPVFMDMARLAAARDAASAKLGDGVEERTAGEPVNPMLRRGAKVSVLGLIMGNLGSIVAVLVGIIITYSRGKPQAEGYSAFLLTITIAGCATIVLGSVASLGIPAIHGSRFPFDPQENKLITICKFPFRRFMYILRDLTHYREAFKYVVAWVLWNIAYSNFMQLFQLSFRATLGSTADKEYFVWQLMTSVIACVGSLTWMAVFRHFSARRTLRAQTQLLKTCLYAMMAVGVVVNFWGSLGASSRVPIGFKHRWEFWFFQVIYVSTSSAIRSLNRVAYSAMLPAGRENQYFGLEIMLGLATGWSQSLLVSVIQDRTGNARFPYIPNTLLLIVSLGFYYWSDLSHGMLAAGKAELHRAAPQDAS
ncbi:AAR080Wp [Eremothecium gossypii ATCC 10895]|uniref:Autophagy-related protein n=1 Tax=Eremothecium gossypii (strain ATCC 10895 / CBS 109.51 / FGSC 9923 / NRRL Y-1056) TaxID=284811 RepID=Q75EJ9_EREGS|nr:AAR080Wp [Eremothecium gossypii ATCC 10895]AAS50445.2 AAR080Wp [Eremothecium gossypii ATCC 10895]